MFYRKDEKKKKSKLTLLGIILELLWIIALPIIGFTWYVIQTYIFHQ